MHGREGSSMTEKKVSFMLQMGEFLLLGSNYMRS